MLQEGSDLRIIQSRQAVPQFLGDRARLQVRRNFACRVLDLVVNSLLQCLNLRRCQQPLLDGESNPIVRWNRQCLHEGRRESVIRDQAPLDGQQTHQQLAIDLLLSHLDDFPIRDLRNRVVYGKSFILALERVAVCCDLLSRAFSHTR